MGMKHYPEDLEYERIALEGWWNAISTTLFFAAIYAMLILVSV